MLRFLKNFLEQYKAYIQVDGILYLFLVLFLLVLFGGWGMGWW